MEINEYQKFTATTAIYPEANLGTLGEFAYLALGLTGEAGEVAEKVKKRIRDGTYDKELFTKELGDVFWYLSRLCTAVGVNAGDVLQQNYDKLTKRKETGNLKGSGDSR